MLFNKNQLGSQELRELTGFMYAYNNFNNILPDVELAQQDMLNLIGPEIVQVAQDHYDSANYGDEGYALKNNLVKHIQRPIAYHAIHSFTQNSDISHEDTGRKVKIDPDNEKLPWEWMLRKDERAILRKAHRTTDLLIGFLDSYAGSLPEWKNSAARAAIRGQFLRSAEEFNQVYPIDSSRRFFLVLSPFIREAELKHIRPVLTDTVYTDMKNALSGTDPFTDPDGLLPLIRVPLALFTMSIAIERLAIEVLPEGVFQNLVSERLTQDAKQPATTEVKREVSKLLQKQARAELHYLQEYIRKLNAEDAGEEFTDKDLAQGLDEDNIFARV